MFSTQSTDLSLGSPCRAADAVKDKDEWMVACKDALYHTQYHADVNELTIVATHDHIANARCVACSPHDSNYVLTAPEQGSSAVLWKYDDENMTVLEETASLLPEGGFGANLVDLAWRNNNNHEGSYSSTMNNTSSSSADAGDVLTLDSNGHLTQWDVQATKSLRSVDTMASQDNSAFNPQPPKVKWDPHSNGDAVAVTTGTSVSILDWRVENTSVPTGTVSSIPHCHRGAVTDLDYNPNKPYVLATAGQDAVVKFWDLRMTKPHPIMTARGGHSHWISAVQYNPFHDQLVLSSGTDCRSNLWRISTISSAPILQDAEAAASESAAPNVRVDQYEHGDSCYAVAWAKNDAWLYLTASFDGKVVVSHVPSKEKYKILL